VSDSVHATWDSRTSAGVATTIGQALRALGHIGAWAGVYVCAAFIFVSQIAGLTQLWPRWDLTLAVLLIATACYALDRVKLRSSWIDPADEASQPQRFAYLKPRAGWVRTAAVVMLVTGAALGARITPWSWAAAIAAPLGVAAYAPRGRGTRGPRLKDRVWLKNTYVGAGIAGFSVLAALASASGIGFVEATRQHLFPLMCAGALVAVRAALDAALCDIDDEETDRRFGTSTPATWLGGRRLWRYAIFARAALTVATLAAWPCPLRARLAWGAAMAAGTVALRARPPRRVRDWVDARFLAEAALTTAALAALQWLAV
jgi:4-hydroxybenzoate polyprenyltransferase